MLTKKMLLAAAERAETWPRDQADFWLEREALSVLTDWEEDDLVTTHAVAEQLAANPSLIQFG